MSRVLVGVKRVIDYAVKVSYFRVIRFQLCQEEFFFLCYVLSMSQIALNFGT